MDEKKFNEIKNEYDFFKDRLNNDIKKQNISHIFPSEDCYLIEDTYLNNLEKFFKDYFTQVTPNKEIIFLKEEPKYINDIKTALDYIDKNKKISLINKKLIELIYNKNNLTNNETVIYYAGKDKLIIKFKDNNEKNALLLCNPLDKKQLKNNIFIIVDNNSSYENILIKNINIRSDYNNIIPFEKYIASIAPTPTPISSSNQNYMNNNEYEDKNSKDINNQSQKDNDIAFKKHLLKIFIYIYYYEKNLTEYKEEILNNEEEYCLINPHWLKNLKKFYNYENLYSLLKKNKNNYQEIKYINLDDKINDIINYCLNKNTLNFDKKKLSNDLTKILKINCFIKKIDNINFLLEGIIIPNKIIELIKKLLDNQIEIFKKELYFKKDIIYYINAPNIIIGTLNDINLFKPKYIFSYNSSGRVETEKKILKALPINEYINLRECNENNYSLQALKSKVNNNLIEIGKLIILQNQNNKKLSQSHNKFQIKNIKNSTINDINNIYKSQEKFNMNVNMSSDKFLKTQKDDVPLSINPNININQNIDSFNQNISSNEININQTIELQNENKSILRGKKKDNSINIQQQMQNKINELTNNINELKKQLNMSNNELKKKGFEINKLKQINNNLQNQINNKNNYYHKKDEENKKKELEIIEKEKEFNKKINFLEEKENLLEKENEKINKKNKEFQKNIETNNKIKNENNKLIQKYNNLLNEIKKKENQYIQLTKQIQFIQNNIKKINNDKIKNSLGSDEIINMIDNNKKEKMIENSQNINKGISKNIEGQIMNQKTKPQKVEPIKSYSHPTLIGLNNIGSTCFKNSVLQCLSQTEGLTNYFLKDTSKNNILNNNIALKNRNSFQLCPAYYELIKNLWAKNGAKSFSPNHFMKVVEEMSKNNALSFKSNEAGDAKDFIIFILEEIHKELKKPIKSKMNQKNIPLNQYDQKNALNYFLEEFKQGCSIISDLFFGFNETQNECINCKNYYNSRGYKNPICYNYGIFNCLIFPLEEVKKMKNKSLQNNYIQINNNIVSIYECFFYNQKSDYFTGDNKNYCNICNQLSDSIYKTKIYTSPIILVLILNRGKGNIYNIKLDFTETIDITEFVLMKEKPKIIYNLYGVITHIGESGPNAHFIASCKSPIDNKWYRYNDAFVHPINNIQKEIIDFGIPYILFYKKNI